MRKILEVTGVRKSFGGLVALDGVDMGVEEGLVTILIGPNGSGKTTLINVVTGLLKADGGRITFDGHDIEGSPPHKVYELGLMRTFQIPLPFHKLTVLENLLTAFGRNPGESFVKAPVKSSWLKREEEATEFAANILHLLNLDHLWNQEASKLSGGQMKLLEMGKALMSGAKMVLMDEPISGVNPVLAHEILAHILELRRKLGITFLFIEHRLDIALQYVDYVYAMDKGRIISEGSPDLVIGDQRVIEAYLGG